MRQARAGRCPSATDEPLRLFTRTSSGLVRGLSMFDAAWFGIRSASSTALPGLRGPGGSHSLSARAFSSNMTTEVGACDA
jgi:hypothetical protein